ncbi:hypothetical protein F1880_007763 [Penicillium rolfsii]|nr:hypothetical protein F1880_007763 [Penicillium rolfsii]
MSNFMHKVKEAVTEHHDKDNVPTNEPHRTQDTYRSTNPYVKDRVAGQHNPSMMNTESEAGTGRGIGSHGTARGPDTYDSANTGANTINAGPHNSKTANKLDPRVDSDLDHRAQNPATTGSGRPDTYDSANRGANTTNAGPHNSKIANKLDPRVDSDLDHRAQNPGYTGSGTQNVGAAPRAMNTGNMAHGGQPPSYGTDTHKSEEENYNKSTSEHKTHTQPGVPGSGNQVSSEDSYSSSTQEHKAHSSTSHTAPCEMNPTAEPGLQGRAAQPEFGGGAAGGSSYTQPPVREQAGMHNTNRTGKVDPQAQGMGYEPSDISNQRSGY